MRILTIILILISISIGIIKTETIKKRKNHKIFMNQKMYEVVKIDSIDNIYLVYLQRSDSIFKVMSNKIQKKIVSQLR